MTFLVWTMFYLYALAVVVNIWWLLDGVKPRTSEEVAVGLVINVGLLVWMAALLFG